MSISRRAMIAGLSGVALSAIAQPAVAVSKQAARSHIQTTVREIVAILNKAAGGPVGAPALRKIMARRSNMARIAQFCAGRAWRDMNEGQRKRYIEAFAHYISVTYARRFNDFSGTPEITVGRIVDAGSKGVLVASPIVMPNGKRYNVEWLVSDRSGTVEIVDLVIERISLAATQRDEIGAMLDKRGGNIDALIKALASTK